VDSSYVSRMVNLTSLAPHIVEAILDETLTPNFTLFELAVDPPELWEDQRRRIEIALEPMRVGQQNIQRVCDD
jgi:hypothetical protein